jgi:transposase
MSKVRGKYTAEFKRQAVAMLVEQGLRVAEVARKLGVSESRLHEWKKQARLLGSAAFPGSGHLTPIEEENRRLKAENRRLEMERDILKKATAFFASQSK